MNNIVEEIKKIDYFSNYKIINNKYLVIKNDSYINDVYFEMCNKNIFEYVIDDDLLKEMYDSISRRMDEVFKYYYDLQDKIEDMLYPSQSYYELLLNISKIYHLVDLGRFFLDKWYEKCGGVIRKIYIIDNYCDYYELDKLKKDYYIFNMIDLYKKKYDYSFFDMINYRDYEKCHFLSYISVCDIINGSNINSVLKLNNYVDRTYSILLEKYKKYQEDNHRTFKE